MLVGFSKYGRGSADAALGYLEAGYLVSSRNKQGILREPAPEVVRGDPAATARVVNASPYRWKYSSGVLSFAPTDRLNEEQQARVMEEFESVLFPGFSRDRFSVCWVRHQHTGRLELHFLAARTDLQTGRSYNPAPPGSRRIFDSFRDKINAEHGLASPTDPLRARKERVPGHLAKLYARMCREQVYAKHEVNLQPGRPDPDRARAAAAELQQLCERQAVYNEKRYGASIDQTETLQSLPPRLSSCNGTKIHDRIGKASAPYPGAFDERISRARDVFDRAVERLGGRTRGWREAHCGLERRTLGARNSRERLEQTAHAFGARASCAINYFTERQVTHNFLAKYGIVGQPRDYANKERELEMEPDLCEDF